MQILRLGDRNDEVATIRQLLAALGLLSNVDPVTVDLFDGPTELAVRAFQQRRGLTARGTVGKETYRALLASHWRLGDRLVAHNATQMMFGDDITDLQRQLLEIGYDTNRPDGYFGPVTGRALQSFQRDMGLLADGVCGPETLRAFRQLQGRRVLGGRPQMLREMMAVADLGPNLLGKRIVIDPGHGGEDSGVHTRDVCEADITFDLATRLEGRLQALGVTTWLTRGRTNGSDDTARAEFANVQGADLVLSLHVDASPSALPNGVSTYYYGSNVSSSSTGERLADLVQREVVARTGLLDCRIHPKTWTMLLLTVMPTVRLELGYLSSPGDISQLVNPAFRDLVAEGLLVAVQRLYLPQDADPQTGVMQLSELAR
jgi:N-acetylmuramoyl-L-alanine amidase